MPKPKKEIDEQSIIEDYLNHRIGTERLALKYGIGKLRVREILTRNGVERKKQGKEPLKEHWVVSDWKIPKYPPIEKQFYLVYDPTTDFTSRDINNKGGCLTTYIKSQYNVDTPSLYDRRLYYMRTGNYWWEQWLQVKITEEKDTKLCPYCGWETIDTQNKSGWFEVHLRRCHNKSVGDYLKEHPEDSTYFSVFTKKEKRRELLKKDGMYVVCPICGERFHKLSGHLQKHNITNAEFAEQYPDYKTSSEYASAIDSANIKRGNLVVSKKRFISKYEREIHDLLDRYNIEYDANRQILIGKEIDILVPSVKIGIEFDGLKFHTEFFGHKSHKYHLDKTEQCWEKGYKLIHIFEDEYVNHKDIVQNKILHILNVKRDTIQAPARKCSIEEIPSYIATEFLNAYHIQGFCKSSIYLGAYFNGRLIAVMSFKKGNIKNPNWELTRFATDYHYTCPGMGSRLFKYFIKTYNPPIIVSFADRRWTVDKDNNLYTKLGFTLERVGRPDYTYYNEKVERYRRFHKMRFCKKNLIKKYGFDPRLTELEMAKSLGYDRIWDCGLLKYVYINTELNQG